MKSMRRNPARQIDRIQSSPACAFRYAEMRVQRYQRHLCDTASGQAYSSVTPFPCSVTPFPFVYTLLPAYPLLDTHT